MKNKEVHNLYYRVSGKGRPVVFLHGFLESQTMWKYLIPFEEYQCIFIDLPGHGKSELDETIDLSMESIAKSVIVITRELELDEYDVIGHSMGGYVAVEMKRNDPSCNKLILLNSNFWTDSKSKQLDRRRVAELVQTKREAFIHTAIPNLFMDPEKRQVEVEDLINEASSIGSSAIAKSSIAMSLRRDNTDVVHDNARMVCIIQGKYDSIVSVKMMREKTIGMDVTLHELPCGHMAHIEHTDELKKVLLNFLAKKTETISFRYH